MPIFIFIFTQKTIKSNKKNNFIQTFLLLYIVFRRYFR